MWGKKNLSKWQLLRREPGCYSELTEHNSVESNKLIHLGWMVVGSAAEA